MAELVGIVGEQGTGKSTSFLGEEEIGIKGLDPKETFLINIGGKPLPKRGWKKFYKPLSKDGKEGNYFASDDSDKAVRLMRMLDANRKDIEYLVIDDYQFIMSFEFLNRSTEKGYDKFTEIGKHAFDILNVARSLERIKQVFVLTHSDEIVKDFETIRKIKTLGRMLDQSISIEGLFTVLLYSYTEWDEDNEKANYYFITNRTNEYPAKSPYGMFKDIKIPNDLGYVSEEINKYYEGE